MIWSTKQICILSIVLGLALLTAACATKTEKLAVNETGSASVTMDETFGRYQESLESRQILVTIEAEQHQKLTNSSTNNGDLPQGYQSFLDRFKEKHNLVRVVDWPINSIDIYCVVFEITDDQNREELLAQIVKDPVVESAQPMQTFGVLMQDYNDPYVSMQSGFRSLAAASSHQWTRGRGVNVAIIDTGLDIEHPEFQSRSEIIRNFVDDDSGQFQADIHGTAVAGVIAAAADNGTGIVGVAPLANLMALKACWQVSDDGKRAVCNSLTLAKALNYAINKGADVINLSLAGPPDPLLQRLVSKAIEENIIVVGAKPAHNRPAFPTATPGTVAVSMTDFSNRNTNTRSVTAPGHQVLSTRPGNQYDWYTGSSFSTAHIAGLAALLREISPTLSPAETLALLKETTDPETGAVNACNAIKMLAETDDQQC